MQVMVLEQDQNFQAHLASALIGKGFQVICVESIGAAENFIRLDIVDILVFGERLAGRLSHSVALLAECRNPLVSAVLLSDRTGSELDEAFDLIPAIYAILGRGVAPSMVAQVVMASTAGAAGQTIQSRLDTRWARAEAAQPAEDVIDHEDQPDMADSVMADGADPTTEQVGLVASVDSPELICAADEGQTVQRGPEPSPLAEEPEPEWAMDPAITLSDAPSRSADVMQMNPALATPDIDATPFVLLPVHATDAVTATPVEVAGPVPVPMGAALIQSWLQAGKAPSFVRPPSGSQAGSAMKPSPAMIESDASNCRLHLA